MVLDGKTQNSIFEADAVLVARADAEDAIEDVEDGAVVLVVDFSICGTTAT